MKLTFPERNVLISLFPRANDYITLKRIQETIDILVATEQEQKEFFEEKEDGVFLKLDKETLKHEVDIEIGQVANDIIVKELKKLSEEKKLEMQHLSLWEKFIEPTKEKGKEKAK